MEWCRRKAKGCLEKLLIKINPRWEYFKGECRRCWEYVVGTAGNAKAWIKNYLVLIVLVLILSILGISILLSSKDDLIDRITVVALIYTAFASIVSVFISKKAIDVATNGPPPNIEVKITKGGPEHPFMISVTNLGQRKIRPLLLLLEIKDRFGNRMRNNGPSKHDDFRIRFKKQWVQKDNKEQYVKFDNIKTDTRHIYPLENEEPMYPIHVVIEPNKWNENKIKAEVELRRKLGRAIKEKKSQVFRLFAGVELPGGREFFSKEYFRITFKGPNRLMTLQFIGKKKEKKLHPDLYYMFRLNEKLELDIVTFSDVLDHFRFRKNVLEQEPD